MSNNGNGVIRFDIKKGIAGILLAAAAFGACCLWLSWKHGAVFAAAFLALGFPRLRAERARLLNVLWSAVMVALVCYVPGVVMCESYTLELPLREYLWNIVCAAVVIGVILVVSGRWKLSVILGTFALMLLFTVNYFVYQFRGKELGPMDILSVGTALSVAGGYQAAVDPQLVRGWFLWLLMAFGSLAFPRGKPAHRIRARLAALVVTAALAVGLWQGTKNMSLITWGNLGTQVNGYYLNFYFGIRNSFVGKPEGYDAELVESYSGEYTTGENGKELPNVIVIMDEAYADLNVLGSPLRTNQPVTPFLDSLSDNCIRGYALASVFGGNTASSEFEFLTGHSMLLLPTGAVAYQQYISGDIFALPWLMESYGYTSIATHPYLATGWSRDLVYPKLGFSESLFLEEYPQEDKIRGYVSDREMFEYVLELLEDRSGEPLFLFGITMQNHGGYTYGGADFVNTIELEGYSQDYPQTEQYLTLLNMTDSAMEYFLTELEAYPEDTIVLVFGDHFPSIESTLMEELHGGAFVTTGEQMLQYQVPFLIWANYDIPEETVECTSLSYLAVHLLEAAGLELPEYYQFLADMEEVIPTLNGLVYYSDAAVGYLERKSAQGEEKRWLDLYAMVQYNNLFDGGSRSETFFEKYINQG